MNIEEMKNLLAEVYREHEKEKSFGYSDELKQKLVDAGILEDISAEICSDPYYDNDVIGFAWKVLNLLNSGNETEAIK